MTKIAKNYEVARATNLQFLTEFYAKIYEMHYTEVYFSPQNEFGVSPDSSIIYTIGLFLWKLTYLKEKA